MFSVKTYFSKHNENESLTYIYNIDNLGAHLKSISKLSAIYKTF